MQAHLNDLKKFRAATLNSSTNPYSGTSTSSMAQARARSIPVINEYPVHDFTSAVNPMHMHDGMYDCTSSSVEAGAKSAGRNLYDVIPMAAAGAPLRQQTAASAPLITYQKSDPMTLSNARSDSVARRELASLFEPQMAAAGAPLRQQIVAKAPLITYQKSDPMTLSNARSDSVARRELASFFEPVSQEHMQAIANEPYYDCLVGWFLDNLRKKEEVVAQLSVTYERLQKEEAGARESDSELDEIKTCIMKTFSDVNTLQKTLIKMKTEERDMLTAAAAGGPPSKKYATELAMKREKLIMKKMTNGLNELERIKKNENFARLQKNVIQSLNEFIEKVRNLLAEVEHEGDTERSFDPEKMYFTRSNKGSVDPDRMSFEYTGRGMHV